MPGHTFLYSPPVNRIRSLIETGELGEVYFISTSRVNLGIHQADISVAWDLAPHDFSILRYWLGEAPTHVSALSRSCIFPEIPDVAFIDLEFPSGTIAHVELSWLAPSKLRRTTIVGSERMVVYDDASAEPVRLFDSGVILRDPQSFGEYQLGYRTGDITSLQIEPAEPLYLEMKDFCGAIRTGAAPRSSGLLGLEVVQMVEAVEASLRQQGARIGLAGFADRLLAESRGFGARPSLHGRRRPCPSGSSKELVPELGLEVGRRAEPEDESLAGKALGLSGAEHALVEHLTARRALEHLDPALPERSRQLKDRRWGSDRSPVGLDPGALVDAGRRCEPAIAGAADALAGLDAARPGSPSSS